MKPTKRAPLEHLSLVVRVECAAGTDRISLVKGHLYKVGKHNQHTRYVEMKIAN